MDFLKQFKTIYISGQPVRVVSVRVHQQNALLTLEGVDMGRFFIPKKGTAL